MKRTRLLLYMGALSAGLIFSGGTQAEDWKLVGQMGWFGVGKAYEMEKGHFYWVGEFSGTFLSDKGETGLLDHTGMKCPAWYEFDLTNKKAKAGGFCTFADPNGDQAYLAWQQAGTPGRGSGNFEWTGGTGKYKDIKGSGTVSGVTTVSWPDGTSSGYAIFNR